MVNRNYHNSLTTQAILAISRVNHPTNFESSPNLKQVSKSRLISNNRLKLIIEKEREITRIKSEAIHERKNHGENQRAETSPNEESKLKFDYKSNQINQQNFIVQIKRG